MSTNPRGQPHHCATHGEASSGSNANSDTARVNFDVNRRPKSSEPAVSPRRLRDTGAAQEDEHYLSATVMPNTHSATAPAVAARSFAAAPAGEEQIGRLDPTAYANLRPVDFSRNPVDLAALCASGVPRRQTIAPDRLSQHSSSAPGVYSDEEEVESSDGDDSDDSSSSDGFVRRRLTRGGNLCRAVDGGNGGILDADASSSVDDDDEDDEWGPIDQNFHIHLDSSSSCEEGLFIPEPVICLQNEPKRPSLPYHTKEELAIGRHVWVVDEEDVETLLNMHYSRSYEMVCNGRMMGTIRRHNGDMTMVSFSDSTNGVEFSLTMPRACLSLKPIEAYEGCATRTSNRVLGSYYCKVGPKASAQRTASQQRKGMLCQQFYERVSALAVPKDSLGDLAEAQSLFQSGSLADALEIVTRKLTKAEQDYAALERSGSLVGGGDTGDGRACEGAARYHSRSPVSFLVDVLVLRSRIFVFMERYEEALQDALRCVELEPMWLRGHLSAARAYSALGNWTAASASVRTAFLQLPTSNELYWISNLTKYLLKVAKSLEAGGHNVCLCLDYMYRKRLIANGPFDENSVVFAEEQPILAMASLFGSHPPGRCTVCFREGAGEMELITSLRTASAWSNSLRLASDDGEDSRSTAGSSTHHPASHGRAGSEMQATTFFCSRSCQQRASLYTRMEARHRETLERARQLIRSRASTMTDLWPLEMAALTLRLFFMVASTHRRLVSQQHHSPTLSTASHQVERGPLTRSGAGPIDLNENISIPSAPSPPPPLPVETALKHLGLYPMVSDALTPAERDELFLLHGALAGDAKEDIKTVYSKELFVSLYNYVSAYTVPVTLSSSSSRPGSNADGAASEDRNTAGAAATPSVVFLPRLVGCISRPRPLPFTIDDDQASFSGAAKMDIPQLALSSVTGSTSCIADDCGGACDIPDSIGPKSGFSLQALLAADSERGSCGCEGSADGGVSSTCTPATGPTCGCGNCVVALCSAHSTSKPVEQCHAEDSEGSPVEPTTLGMPGGPLLEVRTVRPVAKGEKLSFYCLRGMH